MASYEHRYEPTEDEKRERLRDEFAMAALHGFIAADPTLPWKNYAEESFGIADAMLEARDKVKADG